jgi:solute carrier family 34 (sodium-dependent phosphate cotransporter)
MKCFPINLFDCENNNKKENIHNNNLTELNILQNNKNNQENNCNNIIHINKNIVDLEHAKPIENIKNEISYIKLCLNLLGIIITLYGFLFSLGLMGDSFKILGGKTAGELFQNISNPIAGLMIGILATVLVQSSSTSTSVVVGMVGADIITVKTAIPIIMGANIGTSVTNSIVSISQLANINQREKAFSGAVIHDFFNILCVILFLPVECATHFIYYWSKFLTKYMEDYEAGTFKSPLKFIVSPLIKEIIEVDKSKIKKISKNELEASKAGSLIKGGFMEGMDDNLAGFICLGVSLLLLCLFLYGLVKFLKNTLQNMGDKCINYSLQFSNTWWGGYLNILIGTLLTISVQSSSVTTSALTPLVGTGIISLEQMYPITLGANIGTTCTGLLASMVTGKINALQIALCHLSFNIFGVILLYPIEKIRNLPINLAKFYGKVARKYKWFPLFHIIITFILVPLLLLGLSLLFEQGIIGIVFGIIISLLIFVMIITLFYYYRVKKNICIELYTDSPTQTII